MIEDGEGLFRVAASEGQERCLSPACFGEACREVTGRIIRGFWNGNVAGVRAGDPIAACAGAV